MPQKIVTSPLPVRENYEEIPIADVDGDYKRVVLNESGENFLLPFQSEEEKEDEINQLSYIQANNVYDERTPEIEEIANQAATEAVLEAKLPLPALWTESSSPNIINDPFNAWYFERYDPDNIVTKVTSSYFELTPGYVYKISAMMTCQSTTQDFTEVEWRLIGSKYSVATGTITSIPSGNTGILYQEDDSGDIYSNSSYASSVDSTHFVTAEVGFNTRCYLDITYKAPGTNFTHGDSKILFEVVKKI